MRRRAPSEPPKTSTTCGVRREAERGARLVARARQRRRGDRPADRPVLLPVAPDGQREKDAVGERRGEPVREPEVRVGLGERARNPAHPRGEHHRPGDVAACAEHDVGAALPQDPKARGRRRERLPGSAHERDARAAAAGPEIENESNA